MLIMLLAGSDDCSIAKEYALNNLDSDKQWGASATNRLLNQPGLNGNIDAVTNVVQARGEYMLATIEMFNREFGGVEQYMSEYFGFDANTISRVKANLIA